MIFTLWLVAMALAGAGFAGWGVRILLTGRVSERAVRVHRSVADAARYRIGAGAGLLFAATAVWFHSQGYRVVGTALLVVAIASAGLGIVRYPPRFGTGGPGRGCPNGRGPQV
jgi:hypothetical protein